MEEKTNPEKIKESNGTVPDNQGNAQKEAKEQKQENVQEEAKVQEQGREQENAQETKVQEQKQEEKDYRKIIEKMNDEELKSFFQKAEDAAFYLDSLQRAKAEHENYRKRMERDRETIYRYANQDLLKRMLSIMDSLERAIKSASESSTTDKSLLDGICLVQKEVTKILNDFGVSEIKALGEKFDPNYHEAMLQVESKEHPNGTVLQELEKGYSLHSRVLRASKVVVSKFPKEPEEKK